MCHYHQTSPQSHFTQNKVCTLATPNGRITLSQGKLSITEHGEKRELPVSDEAEWLRILQDKFQIVLPAK
jgi:N-hydroxyarylamine O-acetyltransferase